MLKVGYKMLSVEPVLDARKREKKKKAPRLTMMVIPHSYGKAIKNYCLPMWAVKSFLFVSIVCIFVVGYFVTGYFFLKYLEDENARLEAINIKNKQEISELKGLAGSMKERLEALMAIDREVREKIGLTKAGQVQEKSGIESSRAESRYQLITMGVGGGLEEEYGTSILQDALIPFEEGPSLAIAPGMSDSDSKPEEDILSLPIFQNDIDTLEDLKEQLIVMDALLLQQADTLNKLRTDVDRQIAYEKALPSSWPVQGRITSVFGWRRNPFSGKTREFHYGIDIAATYGAPIKAAGDGVVTYAGYKSSWGRLVVISHGFGFVSQYAHNSSLLVKEGDKVTRGQVIARLGNSGRSTGSHVHFGIAKDGEWINPYEILE